MPLPTPHKKEEESEFVNRCMGDDIMKNDYKDQKQRVAVCYSQYKNRKKQKAKASEPVTWDDVRKGDVIGLV